MLKSNHLDKYFPIESQWNPFRKKDLEIAHTKEYIDGFFKGEQPYSTSSGLAWSKEFAESVKYTSASFYHSILNSLKGQICFSPTSGFHHASPELGGGYCTFSGQVIASVKLYQEFKVSGGYIDMDEHFGNSIEDSREFVTDLNKAVPLEANVNPVASGKKYINDFELKFDLILKMIQDKKIHYIVLCSGADSLIDDDLGGSVNLDEWLFIKKTIYSELRKLDKGENKFPTSICLFGGYREDHYESVLDAHIQDLLLCLEIRYGIKTQYSSVYQKKSSR
jgi:acetoin utilization deacetylase AcuC-like enzyme